MRNFNKKVKALGDLFIYKFRYHDAKSYKYKVYYISLDNKHLYISVDITPNRDKLYSCEVGCLYFNEKNNTIFEDTPNETFHINKTNYSFFKNIYEKTPIWSDLKIKKIIYSFNGEPTY
jgi:hypothetical protein